MTCDERTKLPRRIIQVLPQKKVFKFLKNFSVFLSWLRFKFYSDEHLHEHSIPTEKSLLNFVKSCQVCIGIAIFRVIQLDSKLILPEMYPCDYHGTIILRGLRRALNCSPIMPRDTSLLNSGSNFFP